jgi:hypothetical protein
MSGFRNDLANEPGVKQLKFSRFYTTIIDNEGNKHECLLREGWKLLKEIRFSIPDGFGINPFSEQELIKTCQSLYKLPNKFEYANIQEVNEYYLSIVREQAAFIGDSSDPVLAIKMNEEANEKEPCYAFFAK